MKIIKIISLICFLTIGAFAQQQAGSVSGIVSNLRTPFTDGKVVLTSAANQTQRARTDAAGLYAFETVAPGKYRISVLDNRDAVFVSQEITVEPNQSLTVDLTFGAQTPAPATKVGEVTVIATGSAQSLDEVSKTVSIIDAQQLRDRADFALIESLRTIPGFRVQQLGGFGRTASIKTRGLRNQDTAILIDGVRFRDASSITGDASAFLSDFTLTSVARVEVLRGSGSSLYGTNAVGGTIDFQTPRPERGFHGNVSGAGGGYGLKRFRTNLSNGSDDGKFGFNLGVSRTLYSKGIDGQDDAHNTNFQSRIEYNPFQNTNISGRFFISDAYVRLNSNPDTIGTPPTSNTTVLDAVPLSRAELRRYETGTFVSGLNRGSATFIPDANDPDNFQKSQFFNGQLVLTHVFGNRLVFQGYYSGLNTSRKNENGTLGVGFQSASTSIFDGTIHTANGHFNWTPNRTNEIIAGYEFEYEKFGNRGLTPTGAGNFTVGARQSSHTVYAQDLLRFFDDRLQIVGGMRAQFFDLKTPQFSLNNAPYANVTLENPPAAYTFDAAAAYFFRKSGTKLRTHVGNGYRVPSLYERFGTFFSSFGTPRFVALGDPDLQPEKTIAFDGGVEQNVFGNRAKLTAVYFYTKLIDTIGFANVVPAIGSTTRTSGGYLNTKGGIARGAEFSGELKATRSTDIFASYTFTNSDQRVPQVAGSRIIQTLGIPKNQFTLVATQRFARAWINFDFLATDSYLAPLFSNTTFGSYIYRFKGNRRADLTAGYTFPLNGERLNLRVFGTIENLFDDEYYENGFRTFGRNGRVGASFNF